MRLFVRAAVLGLFVALVGQPALAGPTSPEERAAAKLGHLEPYISYFASLSYGPSDARVASDYIRALILTESNGNPRARSNKNAYGLTQITPATARRAISSMAREGYDYLYVDEKEFGSFRDEDLYDPALNILIACYLSATYHERYQGKTELVAAAWNAGPSAVARYGNQPPPYPETRRLISRLLGYMSLFEAVKTR